MTSATMAAAPPGIVPDRATWVDHARGIGILLVVYGHALRALYPDGRMPDWAAAQDRVIYAFHMPLFFLVAGLFIERSLVRGRAVLVRDKLATVAWPYLLWSLIAGGLEIAFSGLVNSPIGWWDLLLIPVRPIEQYWFLYALFPCQMIALAVLPGRRRLVAVTLVCLVVALTVPLGWRILVTALRHLPYLTFGVVAGPALLRLSRGSDGAVAAVGITAWAAFAILLLASAAFPQAALPVRYGAGLAGSIGVAAVAMGFARIGVGGLAVLGRASMAIFVMHTIASAGTRILFKMLGLDDVSVLLAVCTIAGVIIPLAVWLTSERLGLSRLLGIGRGVGQARGRRGEAAPAT